MRLLCQMAARYIIKILPLINASFASGENNLYWGELLFLDPLAGQVQGADDTAPWAFVNDAFTIAGDLHLDTRVFVAAALTGDRGAGEVDGDITHHLNLFPRNPVCLFF